MTYLAFDRPIERRFLPRGRVLTGADIVTREEFDRRVREREGADGPGEDYGGWYCVETRPFPCPGPDCDFVAHHLTVAHLIVVWPESDDPTMLGFCADAKRLGRDPRVAEWEPSKGPAISYYRWARIGRPVHGTIPRPEGVPEPRPNE